MNLKQNPSKQDKLIQSLKYRVLIDIIISLAYQLIQHANFRILILTQN